MGEEVRGQVRGSRSCSSDENEERVRGKRGGARCKEAMAVGEETQTVRRDGLLVAEERWTAIQVLPNKRAARGA